MACPKNILHPIWVRVGHVVMLVPTCIFMVTFFARVTKACPFFWKRIIQKFLTNVWKRYARTGRVILRHWMVKKEKRTLIIACYKAAHTHQKSKRSRVMMRCPFPNAIPNLCGGTWLVSGRPHSHFFLDRGAPVICTPGNDHFASDLCCLAAIHCSAFSYLQLQDGEGRSHRHQLPALVLQEHAQLFQGTPAWKKHSMSLMKAVRVSNVERLEWRAQLPGYVMLQGDGMACSY